MGSEGCSSSESGWTMYISSPIKEDDAEIRNSNISDEKKMKKQFVYHTNAEDDFGSDDSMTSDASSGPRLHCNSRSHGKGSHGKNEKKHSEHKTTNKKEKKTGDKGTKRK